MTVLKCYASFCNLATAGTYHRNMAIFLSFLQFWLLWAILFTKNPLNGSKLQVENMPKCQTGLIYHLIIDLTVASMLKPVTRHNQPHKN